MFLWTNWTCFYSSHAACTQRMNARFRNGKALHLPLSFEVVRGGGLQLEGEGVGAVGDRGNLDEFGQVRIMMQKKI